MRNAPLPEWSVDNSHRQQSNSMHMYIIMYQLQFLVSFTQR